MISEERKKTQIPRFLLAAPGSGSGKTMITCGILAAYQKRGLSLASFKCGPDYIDPMFHRSVLHLPSRNLDSFFTDRETLRYLLMRSGREAALSVVEGVMGYFDGLGGFSTRASTWEVAAETETPVVLIVNCRGMSLSVVPLLRGFAEYEPVHQLQGVILNRVSAMIYPKMKEQIERETGLTVYGYVPEAADCQLESRHLGLKRPGEIPLLEKKLDRLAGIMEETVDLDGLLKLAQTAPGLETETGCMVQQMAGRRHPVRIAVARDDAFDFYYEDNLQLLKDMGAELTFFSPLKDPALPEKTQGVILGGGYPELYAKELSANRDMIVSLHRAHAAGIPMLAECGGFLYLHETLEDPDGGVWPMAGLIPGKAFRTGKLSRFGYISATAREDTLIGPKGETFKGHEFHYWDSTENGTLFRAEKPTGKRGWDCMVQIGNLLAGFPHFYYCANPSMAEQFLIRCEKTSVQDPI